MRAWFAADIIGQADASGQGESPESGAYQLLLTLSEMRRPLRSA